VKRYVQGAAGVGGCQFAANLAESIAVRWGAMQKTLQAVSHRDGEAWLPGVAAFVA